MSDGMSIDDFARRCDTTVRLVREYQTLGVLPPPEKVGRNAVYRDAHLERWQAVARLQERGYSLAAIADLFHAWESGSSLPSVLGVAGSTVGALDETPVLVDAAQLEEEVPEIFGKATLVRRAIKVGLVNRYGKDAYAVRSPALVQLVADAVAAGVPPARALDLAEGLDRHSEAMAATVLEVLGDAVENYDPARHGDFLRRGRPLLAQAAASILIGHVGDQLADAAVARPDVARLIEDLRIGAVNDATTATRRSKRPGVADAGEPGGGHL